jgi:pimeloyl-ACP methyl ester carboxylesterase
VFRAFAIAISRGVRRISLAVNLLLTGPERLPVWVSLSGLGAGPGAVQVGIGVVDVLGLSSGGALAQQFAFQNPRRCRRLVQVAAGTGLIMMPDHPRILAKMVTLPRFSDTDYAATIAGEQRKRLLPAMARYEKIGSFGLTEPEVGSGASGGLQTMARREGETWILNGQKSGSAIRPSMT